MEPTPRYLEVAVPLPLSRTFAYRLPEGLPQAPAGVRVRVPFGRTRVIGLSLGPCGDPDLETVKSVEAVLDRRPLFSPALLQLGGWISDYYLAPLGECFRIMLPPGLLSRKVKGKDRGRRWPQRRLACVTALGPISESATPRQRLVWEMLHRETLPASVSSLCRRGFSRHLLQRLAATSAVSIEPVPVYRSPWGEEVVPTRRHPLTSDQADVVQRVQELLQEGSFATLLLHGVTGSGKTEVYLNIIESVLEQEGGALMMVPEIGLTPQIAGAFRSWFGDRVAILHSGLSEGERFDQWKKIRDGHCQVAVGTRSAVFAPLRNLRVIIVDEEHDGSYKQEETPRYQGRDSALKRAQLEGAVVVLGSATPQLETYHRAVEQQRWEYRQLPNRVLDRPLPEVHIVDMRSEFQKHGRDQLISTALTEAIEQRLERRQQVLVLLNRRGYSAAVLCRSCGHLETCSHCSISLTYHRGLGRLVCHYCGFARSVPKRCSECDKQYIYFIGEGTEKIQAHLQQRFPSARIDRLDRDAVRRKGSLNRILRRFRECRTDLLIGTQMIAKGHDFPGVTLVGVLAADQGLRIADFRSAERTFQLLTQVAGRAGRGEVPGDVIIQTYFPNHYSLKFACSQDYGLFYRSEVQFRRRFRYPPFTALANLLVYGESAEEARSLAEAFVEQLLHHRQALSDARRLRILGPARAPLERLRGDYRFQILIKTTHRGELHRLLERGLAELEPSQRRRVHVDIDPHNLL